MYTADCLDNQWRNNMLPYNKYIKSLSEAPDKISKLRLDAEMEAFVKEALKKESRERALREAADLGKDKNSTLRMLSEPNLPSQTRATLADLASKEAMAKAISDDDISYIIDHARELNQQGRAALEELLLERGDVNKMYSLNKQLGNRYMETDVSDQNRILNDIKKRFGLSEAQSDVDSKFIREASMDSSAVGGEIYDVPVEMSGMSAVPRSAMGDDIRKAMKIDRLKGNRQFLGDIDEILADPDVPLDLVANSSRYEAWIKNMENSLKKRSEAQRNLDSRVREKNRISSGYGRTFDDIGDIHERANTAPLREAIDNENVDYILDQFEEARNLERRNPTPRARDYGGETLYLKEKLSGKNREPKQIGSRTPRYTGESSEKEFLDADTRKLFSEVNRREKLALSKKRKEIESLLKEPKYNTKHWSGEDYRSFASGKTGKTARKNIDAAIEEEVFKDAQSLRKSADEFKKAHVRKGKITYSNKIPTNKGMRASKLDKPANRSFIVNTAKQNGFRLSEQTIERLLKATKQQVIDYIDNIANPMPSQRKRK